jgi:hypothetical protein
MAKDEPNTPSMSKSDLVRLAIALGIALIAWPTALWALHGAFFRPADATGNGPLIVAGIIVLVAVVATWVAVFLLSRTSDAS